MKSFQQKRDQSQQNNALVNTSSKPIYPGQMTQSLLYIQSNTYGGRTSITTGQASVNNVILGGSSGGSTGGTGPATSLILQTSYIKQNTAQSKPLETSKPIPSGPNSVIQSKSLQRPNIKSNESQRRQLQITNSNTNATNSNNVNAPTQGTTNILNGMSFQKNILTNQNLQGKSMMQQATKSQPIATQAQLQTMSNKAGLEFSNQQNQAYNATSGLSQISQSTAQTTVKKNQEVIVIHVFDENRKVNKDFTCEKDLLVNHMKYFEKYLTEATSVDDIDISVHCDIKIFEWLMKYLKQKEQDATINKDDLIPKLDIKNVISILISSDFLQMQILVQECIDFVIDNLHDVVRLPIDMNCLNQNLIKRIANQVTIEKLDDLVDKRDKLTSKLFMKKLQILINQNDSSNQSEGILNRCIYCGQLYTNDQNNWMICPNAKIFIDFHGQVIAQHVSDRFFDLNGFIQYMNNQKQIKWKDIYWKIWARLITLDCSICESMFIGSDLLCCRYHPQKPKFNYGSNKGSYPCCGAQALRFSTHIEQKGCQATLHTVKVNSDIEKDYLTLEKHKDIAVETFNNTGQPVPESLQGLLDAYIVDMKSKRQKLRSKRQPNKSNLQSQNGDTTEQLEEDLEEEECEEDDDDDYDYIKDQLLQPNNATQNQQSVLQNCTNDGMDRGKKQKMWKKDFLRSDDWFKMKDLSNKLKKHRMNESSTGNSQSNKQKAIAARTNIQQTQGSTSLIKRENLHRKSYLIK